MRHRTSIEFQFRTAMVVSAVTLTCLSSFASAADSPAPAPVQEKGTPSRRAPAVPVAPVPGTAGRTTIAPFPIPGDTAADRAARARWLNVPKPGLTTVAPLPPPAGSDPGVPGATDDQGSPPRLRRLDQTAPQYPRAARDAGIQGTVWVRARVLANGMVREAKAVRGPEPLRHAAEESVRRWRFEPPSQAGRVAPMWIVVPVRFTLH